MKKKGADGVRFKTEDEEQRYGRNKDTIINRTYINSGDYRKKFDRISSSHKLNRLLYQLSKKMLEHRSGTEYEDMYWIDPQSIAVIAEETESDFVGRIDYTTGIISKIQKYNDLITLHSHPNSFPPSINDLNSNYYNLKVEKFLKSGYNECEAQLHALKELQSKFEILVKEVSNYGI